MKNKFSGPLLRSVLLVLAAHSLAPAGLAQSREGANGRDSAAQSGDPSFDPPSETALTVPVYRFLAARGGHHFLTLDADEGRRAGMRYEGIAFYVFNAEVPGTVPIFRCLAGGDHFVSNFGNCEGKTTEGLYGYVFSGEPPFPASAIYRCYNNKDHLSTINPGECTAARYGIEGVQGYAPQL